MIVPFAAIAFAQLFDLATFLVMFARHGIAAELNPIVVHIASGYGIPFLALVKVALVLFVAAVFAICLVARRPRVATSVLSFAVLMGVVGGLSNIASV
jgi:hypothetical protein